MSLIEVRALTFEYPGKKALDKVSFSIESGSVTALVGPNGAGKTTLMNCLAALVARPAEGPLRRLGARWSVSARFRQMEPLSNLCLRELMNISINCSNKF